MSKSLNKLMRQEVVSGAGHLMPGAANALAARVIEAAGYRMMMVSGAAVANTYLGVPDIGLVSVTELAGHVAAVRDAVTIPILADADTGFGNAINARRTVQLLERAGANGIMLEDQTYPKRCGHFEGKDVVPKEEMVSKLKAAVDARIDPDLMILARTDARAVALATLAPLAEHDASHGTALVATMRAWLEHGGQFDATAQSLGVHRHTVRSRVALAERLLGRDLSGFHARADLWAALLAVD